MDELAIVASTAAAGVEPQEWQESIAEHNLNRKRVLSLEQGVDLLKRTARQQSEIMAQLESGMKTMISEIDLRRAIGITFEEFEHRLEDTFQDSNRKCLAMFSKRAEVSDLQSQIEKKVNWAEYHAVLQKLRDLRQYIDTMAESVFIGHRDALNGEFAKKADASMVDQALKSKASVDEVNEVRARLERLEVLVAQTDARQTAAIEALRDETAEITKAQSEKQLAMIAENSAAIAAIREERAAFIERLGGAESRVAALGSTVTALGEAQQVLKSRQERLVMPAIESMQEQLSKHEASYEQTQQQLQALADEAGSFRESSEQKFGDLSAQVKEGKEHFKFLIQETDMIKRRARESNKTSTTKFKEVLDAQEVFTQQWAALEKQCKRHERDVRAIENRTTKMVENGGALKALMPPLEADLSSSDPNLRLKNVLDQLEKIADGGPPLEQLGLEWNSQRPPLPLRGHSEPPLGTDEDFAKLPRYGATEQAPIDSARGGNAVMTSSPRMYGLSPRAPVVGAPKAGRKKR